jgi:hypothetical protein
MKTTSYSRPGGDKVSGQVRYMAHESARRDESERVIDLLPEAEEVRRQIVQVSKESLFNCPRTVLFSVINRHAALSLMTLLPPLELMKFKLKSGAAFLRPSCLPQPVDDVVTRVQMVPFVYHVLQGPTYGPFHHIRWATRTQGEYLAIEVSIAGDSAGFTQETRTHSGFRHIKWEANGMIPKAYTWSGSWGRWYPATENEPASLTCSWPIWTLDPHVVSQGWKKMFEKCLLPLDEEGHYDEVV